MMSSSRGGSDLKIQKQQSSAVKKARTNPQRKSIDVKKTQFSGVAATLKDGFNGL